MSQQVKINFAVGAFPIGFKGNCQDFANALVERLSGTIELGLFQAQYGGPQPSSDVGPWWKNGTDLYVFDYSTGQYQPMEDQFPIGGCVLWGGPGAPARFLLCQGQSISRNQFQRLFQRIGTQWGAISSDTFNLPPCGQYLVAAGYDSISGVGNTYNNGSTGGTPRFTLSPNQLPELYMLACGKPNNAMAGTGRIEMGPATGDGSGPLFNWPVYSADGLAVTQRNGPLTIQPNYQAMNLCIRYI